MQIFDNWIDIVYLILVVFFVLGIKGLIKLKIVVWGNLLVVFGMGVVCVVILLYCDIVIYEIIIGGVIVGGIIGVILVKKV